MLTKAQIEEYNEVGAIVVPDVLTPDGGPDAERRHRRFRRARARPDRPYRRSTTSRTATRRRIRGSAASRRRICTIRPMPRWPGIRRSSAVLQALWGPDIRFDTAKLNMKCAGFGAPVEWHQDWAFYPHTNDNLAAVGVMFDDMAMENGPLMIIPGSHKGPTFDHHADGVFCGAMDPANRDVDYGKAMPLTGQGRLDHRASCAGGAWFGAERFGPGPAVAAVPVPRGGRVADPRLSRRDRGVRRADGRRPVAATQAGPGAGAAAAAAGRAAGLAV